jgi:glycosyltransferase involved in cell wall biosynthesis
MSRVVVIAGEARSLVDFRGHLIKAMLQAGHDVHAFAPPHDATRRWLASHGATFHAMPISRAAISPLRDAWLVMRLVRALSTLRPELVLTYTIKPNVYGILAAAIARVPRRYALITGLGYAFTGLRKDKVWRVVNTVAKLLYRACLRFSTAVIFQNEDDRNEFDQLFNLQRRRTHVVNGSGVDLHRFAVAPLPEEPRFLLIARLLRDKGVGEYLAAARLTRHRRPAARFDLVGPTDPSPGAFPIEDVRRAVAENVIVYHGAINDVRPFIASSRFYVLPSYREGTPRSVLEAMAMGRPIITTDVPGCRATVTQGDNGVLVPPAAVEPLVEAMIYLIDRPEKAMRMGARSRLIAEQKFDVRIVSADMMRILWGGQAEAKP